MSPPDAPVRIALIHALEESIGPARMAFRELWPEAYCFDLLDTALAVDLAHNGILDGAMIKRFQGLAEYASSTTGVGGVAAGILFTCSAFGPAIDAVKAKSSIPVLRPIKRPSRSRWNAATGLRWWLRSNLPWALSRRSCTRWRSRAADASTSGRSSRRALWMLSDKEMAKPTIE